MKKKESKTAEGANVQKEARRQYIEYCVADILDDVDSSLSTLKWRDQEIIRLEGILDWKTLRSALKRFQTILLRTTHYCSGAPFDPLNYEKDFS